MEQQMHLEALLLGGLTSKSIPLDDDFWKTLRAKTAEIVERQTACNNTKRLKF